MSQVWNHVGTKVWDQVSHACWGQHDASWLSFYDYFRSVVGLECCERLAGLIRVAECCGWWWPLRGAVVLTERPVYLARDTQGRLHDPHRAAIEYSDGWRLYAWHGVHVPEKVICRPLDLTAAEITAEPNVEVRRVMLERYMPDRYLIDIKAKPIHQDTTGELYKATLTDDEPLVFVKVKNSTPEPDGTSKEFFLRVPPTIQRAREAVAWTFRQSEKAYHPIKET